MDGRNKNDYIFFMLVGMQNHLGIAISEVHINNAIIPILGKMPSGKRACPSHLV